jgi:hypothetical protein
VDKYITEINIKNGFISVKDIKELRLWK